MGNGPDTSGRKHIINSNGVDSRSPTVAGFARRALRPNVVHAVLKMADLLRGRSEVGARPRHGGALAGQGWIVGSAGEAGRGGRSGGSAVVFDAEDVGGVVWRKAQLCELAGQVREGRVNVAGSYSASRGSVPQDARDSVQAGARLG